MNQIKKVEIVTKTGERYGCHTELIPGSGCYTINIPSTVESQEIDKWIIYNE